MKTLYAKITDSNSLLSAQIVARAVYLHGLAGDLARDVLGERSMMASDVPKFIGKAFAILEAEAAASISAVRTGKGGSLFTYLQR